jgi:putative SOS response-associated peptidase YedK
MCNLYTIKPSMAEVAARFGVDVPSKPFNAPEEMYPGTPGVVVTETRGEREMRSMVWGFPIRLRTMKPESKPKPVNNIADLRKPMWSGWAGRPQSRCLIPMSAFCEAEGKKGAMTRTWFSVRDEPVFAWAGLWRVSDEWGPVYSGAMTDCNEAIRPVHDRMPVILHQNEWDQWLRGSFSDAVALQERCFPAELIVMDRTTEPWRKPTVPVA